MSGNIIQMNKAAITHECEPLTKTAKLVL